MIDQVVDGDSFFRIDLPRHPDPGLAHAGRIAGYQRMPPGERLALVEKAIGAGGRKPAQCTDVVRRQAHAVRHPLGPIRIVAAAAGPEIQKLAGCPRVEKHAGVLVFQLVEAAAAAAVAQAFPLGAGHLAELLGRPEGFVRRHGAIRSRAR